MLELLHYIVTKIVSNPDDVKIETQEEDKDNIVYVLKLPEEERGVVIGKGGMNIRAIRNILNIIAKRENKRVYIKVAD